MSKNYILYHNDLDGHCAGAIVYQYLTEHNPNCSIELIECSYNKDFGDFEEIDDGSFVWVVDFGFQKPGDWDKLIQMSTEVYWIDHHKTAMGFEGAQNKLDGIRRTGDAACLLTWEFLGGDNPVPEAVVLADDWDTWKHKLGAKTLEFMHGMQARDTHPNCGIWEDLLRPEPLLLDDILAAGGNILRFVTKDNEEYLRSFGYEVEFEGLKGIVCNKGKTNSKLFDSVAFRGYDILMPVAWNGEQWTVSIYTTKDNIDCAEIAKKYGGGGHTQAAGFQCKELPFKIKGASQ